MKEPLLRLRYCVDEVCADLPSLFAGKKSKAVEKLLAAGDAGLQAVLAGPTKVPKDVHGRDVCDGLGNIAWLIAKRDPQPILAELERSPNRNMMLVSALRAAKCDASVKALIDAMSDRNQYVRWAAVEALIARKAKAAKPVLIKAILDRSSMVCFSVVDAINKLDVFRDPVALPNLRRLLTQKRVKQHSPGTWQRAQEAVARLEQESQGQPVLEASYAGSDIKNRDLARLVKELPMLCTLDLSETNVGDAGVKHLLGLHELRKLDLQNTKVTWRGVADIATSPMKLKSLALGGIAVNPAQLRILSGMTQLEELDLGGVKTTDIELLHLTPLRSLKTLSLFFWCGDAGLKALKKLKKLETLVLYDSQVTDLGLSSLKSMKCLTSLSLDFSSAITDAGIEPLGCCKKLRHLRLNGTRVSPAGVARLSKLLPDCQIES